MDAWMDKLPERCKRAPLSLLKIPGSHDSGAYNLRLDDGLANDQNLSPFVRWISRTRLGLHMVKRWSETQCMDVVEQLRAGVRYLDVRLEHVAQTEGNGIPFLVHGLYGDSALVFFGGVMDFLERNPSEVVFIDINHVYKMGTLEFTHFVCSLLLRIFPEETICPVDVDFTRVSLKDLVHNGIRVVVVGPFVHSIGRFVSKTSTVDSPWPNENRIRTLIEFLQERVDRPAPRSLHVLQGVITVRTSDVLSNLSSSLKCVFSDRATAATLAFVKSLDVADLQKVNIVLVDQITENFCAEIVAINYQI